MQQTNKSETMLYDRNLDLPITIDWYSLIFYIIKNYRMQNGIEYKTGRAVHNYGISWPKC